MRCGRARALCCCLLCGGLAASAPARGRPARAPRPPAAEGPAAQSAPARAAGERRLRARVGQAPARENGGRCALAPECAKGTRPADFAQLCTGVPAADGGCYVVSGLEEIPPDCNLTGPAEGVATFVSASPGLSTIKAANLSVSGSLALLRVRLEASSWLEFQAARLSSDLCFACHRGNGGGISAVRFRMAGNSSVTVARACVWNGSGGAVYTGSKAARKSPAIFVPEVTEHSVLTMLHSAAYGDDQGWYGYGGGFYAENALLVSSGARLKFVNTSAKRKGGAISVGLPGHFSVIDGAGVEIEDADAKLSGGGICTQNFLFVGNGASVQITNARTTIDGGGIWARKQLTLTNHSKLKIAHTEAINGGGFFTDQMTTVSNGSQLIMEHSKASGAGGGFHARSLIVEASSRLRLSDCIAGREGGGGFHAEEDVVLVGGSEITVVNASAARCGGFRAYSGSVYVAERSLITLTNTRATEDHGGGLCAELGVDVVQDSGIVLINASAAASAGGLLSTRGHLRTSNRSWFTSTETSAFGGYGGVLFTKAGVVVESGSNVTIESSRAAISGGGFSTDGPMMVSEGSLVKLSRVASTGGNAGAFEAPCLRLDRVSGIELDQVAGGTGIRLAAAAGNPRIIYAAAAADAAGDAGGGCGGMKTLHVQDGSFLTAARADVVHGVLHVLGAEHEHLELSHVRAKACKGPVATVEAKHVTVRDLEVTAAACVGESDGCSTPVLHVPALADFQSVSAVCDTWRTGCEFNMRSSSLYLASGYAKADCPGKASIVNNDARLCPCVAGWDQITHSEDVKTIRDKDKSNMYCVPCARNEYYSMQDHVCETCPIYQPWSLGANSPCGFLPKGSTLFLAFLCPAGVAVAAAFLVVLILWMPFYIVDMTRARDAEQQEHDHRTPASRTQCSKKTLGIATLVLTIQGMAADVLPRQLKKLLFRWTNYRIEGTGSYLLDGKNFALRMHGRRQVQLAVCTRHEDCSTSQGCLYVLARGQILVSAIVVLWLLLMAPATLVLYFSGIDIARGAVTMSYMVFLWTVGFAVISPLLVSCVCSRYSRTPLADAHLDYRHTISPHPYAGADAEHPQHSGIRLGTIVDLYDHYKAFILDRSMYYVVSNVVRPLTKPAKVSFSALWGGQTVTHFVSHCWGTSFADFLASIQCHAVSVAGAAWREENYWICSFSNNQWKMSSVIGATIMESAFARVLMSESVRDVVMVLDGEVQALQRVWCLFEVMLSRDQSINLCFATPSGVIGSAACSSFDIPVSIAKRIEGLRVAECEASNQDDKRSILAAIVERFGSLENMDAHIGVIMASGIEAALGHTSRQVADLVQRLAHRQEEAPPITVSLTSKGLVDGVRVVGESPTSSGGPVLLGRSSN